MLSAVATVLQITFGINAQRQRIVGTVCLKGHDTNVHPDGYAQHAAILQSRQRRLKIDLITERPPRIVVSRPPSAVREQPQTLNPTLPRHCVSPCSKRFADTLQNSLPRCLTPRPP